MTEVMLKKLLTIYCLEFAVKTEADLTVGGGHELEKKFRAVHSSSALAINTFAPFKISLEVLTVAGKSSFKSIQFEKRLQPD
jgi:hypothetical protein